MLVEGKLYALPYERELALSEREALLSLLDKSCRRRVENFHSFADQDRSILGEYLCRRMLSVECGIAFDDIHFKRTALGKPYWNGEAHFNISHSHGWILCGISSGPIGVDVELIKPVNPLNMKTVLTTAEEKFIAESRERDKAFFRIWSAKESYLKALGKGFHISPREVEFNPVTGEWIKTVIGAVPRTEEYSLDSNYLCMATVLNGKLPVEVVNTRDLLY